MSGYITAYIFKTANVITYVTAHFHVALICTLLLTCGSCPAPAPASPPPAPACA